MKQEVWVTNIEWSTGRARENLPGETLVGVECVNAPYTHAWTTEVNQKIRNRLTVGFGERPSSFVWQLRDSEDDPWDTGELGTREAYVQTADSTEVYINELVPLRVTITSRLRERLDSALEEGDWSNEGQLVRAALREYLENQNR